MWVLLEGTGLWYSTIHTQVWYKITLYKESQIIRLSDVERLEPSKVQEMVGVYIAMGGNWREEIQALKEKTSMFTDQLRIGTEKPNEAWYAFNFTNINVWNIQWRQSVLTR
jgi:hypothetical protein